jgi:hypothetical protein
MALQRRVDAGADHHNVGMKTLHGFQSLRAVRQGCHDLKALPQQRLPEGIQAGGIAVGQEDPRPGYVHGSGIGGSKQHHLLASDEPRRS